MKTADQREIEQDQEGQGSNQTGLGERQEIEIPTDSCLGNYQSSVWMTISRKDFVGALPYHSIEVVDRILCS